MSKATATPVATSWKRTSVLTLLWAVSTVSSCRITNLPAQGGVLRGLHFQIEHPQSKLVRVVQGRVFDVCVDLRPGSKTYGKWEGVVLSAENHRQFFIPRGFAHGFLVLSDYAVFCYKCDDVYHPNDEGGLMWNDPDIAIEWPTFDGDDTLDASKLVLSDKDMRHPHLADLKL